MPHIRETIDRAPPRMQSRPPRRNPAHPGRRGRARIHVNIREAFADVIATGVTFTPDGLRPPMEFGDLAITSAKLGPNAYTREDARRQMDGTWRWVTDIPDFLA